MMVEEDEGEMEELLEKELEVEEVGEEEIRWRRRKRSRKERRSFKANYFTNGDGSYV